MACVLTLIVGGDFFTRMEERILKRIIAHHTRQLEEISRQATPQFQALQEISRAITDIGNRIGLELRENYVTAANENFCRLASQSGKLSDAVLVEKALSYTYLKLDAAKQEYAEAALAYWETVAAIGEAEAALANTAGNPHSGEAALRLRHLSERLFSGHLLGMVMNLSAAAASEKADYENIINAIKLEAATLITETKTDPRDKANACAVLGLPPEVPDGEIDRVYQVLLLLWQPDGDDDAAARERYAEVQQAYTFLKQHGHV